MNFVTLFKNISKQTINPPKKKTIVWIFTTMLFSSPNKTITKLTITQYAIKLSVDYLNVMVFHCKAFPKNVKCTLQILSALASQRVNRFGFNYTSMDLFKWFPRPVKHNIISIVISYFWLLDFSASLTNANHYFEYLFFNCYDVTVITSF